MKYYQYSLVSRVIPGPDYAPEPYVLYADPVNLGAFASVKEAKDHLRYILNVEKLPKGTKVEDIPWEDAVEDLSRKLDEAKQDLENFKEESEQHEKMARDLESLIDELYLVNGFDLDTVASSLRDTGAFGSIKHAIGNVITKLQKMSREHFTIL